MMRAMLTGIFWAMEKRGHASHKEDTSGLRPFQRALGKVLISSFHWRAPHCLRPRCCAFFQEPTTESGDLGYSPSPTRHSRSRNNDILVWTLGRHAAVHAPQPKQEKWISLFPGSLQPSFDDGPGNGRSASGSGRLLAFSKVDRQLGKQKPHCAFGDFIVRHLRS